MPGFEQGDVVRVPFPYTDRSTRQRRPALVVSRRGLGEEERLIWVAMITSAENRPWPGDIPFGAAFAKSGLTAPSVIRPCKLATIDGAFAERIGRADEGLVRAAAMFLLRALRD